MPPHPPPTRRPFHRSRSFWFGLPVLVFLLWAWWDSTRFLAIIGRESPHTEFQLASFMGAVQVGYFRIDAPGRTTRWHYDHMPLSKLQFDRAEHSALPRYVNTRGNSVAVAYWFLISLYGVAWLGSSLLWSRRKTRLMTASTPPS